MLLEGRRNSLDYESCQQLTKNLHKHDKPHVLNLVQSSLRDRNEPFSLPSIRSMVLGPHGDKAIAGFGDNVGGPVLNLFVLEPRGAARRMPQDNREFIQRRWGREEICTVCLNPVAARGRAVCRVGRHHRGECSVRSNTCESH